MPALHSADQDLLHKLLLGQLSTAEVERLATEYADDGRLAELAESLAGKDDALLALLHNHESAVVEPEGERLVERLLERLKPALPDKPRDDTVAMNKADASTEPSSPDVTGKPQPLPERLEYYRPIKVLGQGGMGTVYLAEDTRLGREVAIKTLRPELAINPQAKERFLREARSAAKLHHDHIIPIYSVGEAADGTPFLAMPLLKGEPLDELIRRTAGPLPVALVVRLAREAASGLAAAHARGLIHRDIKPANIWLEAPTGRVKILDFGLAKAADAGNEAEPQTHLTASGAIVGTPAYMAPEQASGYPVDGRADLFSLGCVLYELLAGKRAFSGPNTMSILMSLANHTPPAPDKLSSQCPAALSRLVMQLLEKDPTKRPVSADAVIQALSELDIESVQASRAASAPGPSQDATAVRGLTPSGSPTERLHPSHSLLTMPATEVLPIRKRSIPKQRVALALGGALLTLLAAVVYRVQTDRGTLVVTIEDPAVQAILEQDGLVIHDKNNDRKWTIKATETKPLPSGKYQLQGSPNLQLLVTDDSGAELTTDTFTLKRKGEIRVRVTLEQTARIAGKETATSATAAATAKRATNVPTPAAPVWRPTPEQQEFLDAVAKLPADEQVAAVSKKLSEINPGFDGKLTPAKEGAKVVGITISDVTNLWPVRALPHLKTLQIGCSHHATKKLSDLSPLAGLPLASLNLHTTSVSDLSPLAGMRLTSFTSAISPISDLTPLAGMPLTHFACGQAPLSDLTPLVGMQLKVFRCDETSIADVALLAGMPLTSFNCAGTQVSDLAPLVGMPLTSIDCRGTKVADLTPLKGMSLNWLLLNSTNVRDLTPLAGMPLHVLQFSNTAVSDLTPLAGMPLNTVLCSGTRVADLSPLKGLPLTGLALDRTSGADLTALAGMPLSYLRIDIPLFHEPDEKLVRSLAPRNMGGESWDPTPAEKFWETYLARQQAAEAFATATAKLPAEEQVQAITARFRELNMDQNALVGFKPEIRDGQIVEVTLTLAEKVEDVTPLRALAHLKSLTIVGGPHWLDLSPLNSTPLESLTCRDLIARRNAHILKSMPKLTKIDARPEPTAAPVTTKPATNPDRRAAEYVLSIGGSIKIKENGQGREIAAVGELPQTPFELQFVDLHENQKVSDTSFSPFQGCTNLVYLNLGGTKVSDAGLAHFQGCKNLSTIVLTNTPVSDAGMAYFKNCQHIVWLDVTSTKVTDSGVVHFTNCQSLTTLFLGSTAVGDAGLAHFQDCKKLEWCKLENTKVTDTGLGHLKGWNNLKNLDLSATQVSDRGLAQIKTCTKLAALTLNHTQLTDAGLEHLKSLQNLTYLKIGDTQASDTGLEFLKEIKSLTYLELMQTKVTEAGVKKLSTALPKCRIEWDGGVIEGGQK